MKRTVKQYDIYVSLKDKDNNLNYDFEDLEALVGHRMSYASVVKQAGVYSVGTKIGGYYPVKELLARVTVIDGDYKKVIALAEVLKEEFNQETVLITTTDVVIEEV